MSKVLNLKHIKFDPKTMVKVDRSTEWGNPFIIGRDGDRKTVIKKYKEWITQNKLMKDLPKLKGKDLLCWCAPEPCHADVLLVLANTNKQRRLRIR